MSSGVWYLTLGFRTNPTFSGKLSSGTSNISPPKFFKQLLRRFCREELYEEIQGDLEESFMIHASRFGQSKANRRYAKEVLLLFRPSVIHKFRFKTPINISAMFRINVKLAFRNLLKSKLYTAINIGGLSISIAVCLLILLYVGSETNYDNYHPNKDRLYRLALDRIYPDHVSKYALTPLSMAEQAAEDFPEIEAFTRIFPNTGQGVNIVYENESFLEDDFFAVDKNFFEVFGIELLRGSKEEVFNVPNATVITQKAATRYFGDEDPIGKILKSDFGELLVSGVSENVPDNTHFHYDLLVHLDMIAFLQRPNFINFSVHNYLLLKEGIAPTEVEHKYQDFVEKYAGGQIERRLNMPYSEYVANGNGYDYYLQPIEEIHLRSHLDEEFEVNGNITYIYIFLSIAVFILILAVVNFINLATARSTERAKEIGIRKVLGSEKRQLVNQFLMESIMVSVGGTIASLGLVMLTLPAFNGFADKSISGATLFTLPNMAILAAFSVVLGSIAGLYPALVLSSFQPVTVLKGKLIRSKKGYWLRNGLVVFQFFISVALICSTLITRQQINYLQQRNLGFDRENILVLDRAANIPDIATFQNEIQNIPGVVSSGASSAMPGTGFYFGSSFQVEGMSEQVAINCVAFDEGFLQTMDMKVMEGRAFSEEFQDSLSIIVNTSAAKALGIYDNPIGHRVTNFNPNGGGDYFVVGMIEDYNYKSLHMEISPLIIFHDDGPLGGVTDLAIRINARKAAPILDAVTQLWQEKVPDQAFNYNFLDENLGQLYDAERRSGNLFLVFTGVAIWIACIGLFGLATFIMASRIKEIGIRKVLGASSRKLVFLLMGDFNKLILIAILIAVPLVVWGMDSWLQTFAYRIRLEQTWTSFAVGAVIALVVAWITISYHSIRAAMANPTKSLKNE